MTSRYIDGSRVVYWDDLTGNLTVPATLTATSVVGASFTLGPNVTFSSVTASTINVGSLTTPVVSTLKVNASSITANTVSSLSAQTSSLVANNLSSLTVRTSSLVTNNLSSLTAQTGVLTATRTTVSSLVGNNVSSLTAQIKNITVSSLIGLPTTFYVLAAATNPSYGSTLTMNYSYDLVNWTPVQTSFYGSIGGSAVRVKKINGVYFAMGFNNANQTVLTPLLRSVDGINWVKPTSIPVEANNDITLTNIMYGNNLYVAVGRNGCQGYVWRSTDGQTWTDSTTSATTGLFYPDPGCGSAGIQAVAYGNGTWVVVGGSASYYGTYYSTDGITFLFSTSNPMSGSATSVDFDGTKFIQVGFDSLPWRWSTDGITWSYLVFSGDLAWTNNAKNIAYNGTMWLATTVTTDLPGRTFHQEDL